MLFSMPRIIQHSYNFFCSRTPKPKLLTTKLGGSGTKTRPRIRPQFRRRDAFSTSPFFLHWSDSDNIVHSQSVVK